MSKLARYVALPLIFGLALATPVGTFTSAVQAQTPQPTTKPTTIPRANPTTKPSTRLTGKKCRNKNGRVVRCKPVPR